MCKAGGSVYLAAYTGGELMEYDPSPSRPARFPDNPRVVADPPLGMRPVGMATDGRVIWYSCSHEYGTLGCVVTRYDTVTGLASYASWPLGEQQIISIVYDRATATLLCGSSIHADCQSCPPTQSVGRIARLRGDDMSVLRALDAPAGAEWALVSGPVATGQWLGLCEPARERWHWFLFDDELKIVQPPRPLPKDSAPQVHYAGRPGRFVLTVGWRIELWDFSPGSGREPTRERVLHEGDEPRLVAVDGEDVLYTTPREVVVLEGSLR